MIKTAGIEVEMMSQDFVLWRCLHEGPLSKATIDGGESDTALPWARYRARNKALLVKFTRIYGACGVVARSGDLIVGILRFYPKTVWQMERAGFLCLQQDFPSGPVDDFAALDFPLREHLEDQSLKIHCLMIRSPGEAGNLYRRKGIATRMVQKLIEWAGETAWRRIEVEAFEDLPIIYQVTGSAGLTFWEKLGFRVADRFPHPYLLESSEFVTQLEEEAAHAGIDANRAKDCIVMRLDLA